MKKIYLSLAFSFFTFYLFAQSKDKISVETVMEQLRVAMVDGNGIALSNLAADSLSYGHSSGLVENKTTFVNKIASGKSDFVNIDMINQSIALFDNTAVVRNTLIAKTNDGGVSGDVKLNVLYIWKKTKGEWKLIARQAVKVIV